MRMRTLMLHLFALLCLSTGAAAQGGTLVVVGGGNTGSEIVSKTLALAGGSTAIVAVLAQSSPEPEAGIASVKMWGEAGARDVANVAFDDRQAAAAALRRATLIWIPGGDQNRFMRAVDAAGLADVIRERYRQGAVVGGTSAGAAVMSEAMITGDADLQSLTTGKTAIARGLGLWPEVIVDQHFLTRQRGNRLLSAVLDRPQLVGVGIDESTAVMLRGSSFEVVGRSAVVVIDPRGATVEKAAAGEPVSGRGLKVSVLRAGMSYSLE